MNLPETRVMASYLSHCSPNQAYRWIEESDLQIGGQSSHNPRPKVLEYILCRRNSSLIDLALGKYAYSHNVAERVFRRGDLGVRCAALSGRSLGEKELFNEYGWLKAEDILQMISSDSAAELLAIAGNPFLNDQVLQDIINCNGPFASLSGRRYLEMLNTLADNPALKPPEESRFIDSYDGFNRAMKLQLSESAWQLVRDLKPSSKAAGVLVRLLRGLPVPTSNADAEVMIELWRYETERDEKSPFRSAFFHLRSRIADMLPVDESLAKNPDIAIRGSFYRRFRPSDFPEWPAFVENEDVYIFDSLLLNSNLWQREGDRDTLKELARQCRHPDSDSFEAINYFVELEDRFRGEHPEWFHESNKSTLDRTMQEIRDHSKAIDAQMKLMFALTNEIKEVVNNILNEQQAEMTRSLSIARRIDSIGDEFNCLSRNAETLKANVENLNRQARFATYRTATAVRLSKIIIAACVGISLLVLIGIRF